MNTSCPIVVLRLILDAARRPPPILPTPVMELPLVLGLAGGRDPGEALSPGLDEAVGRLAADLTARFPGAPWIVSTARDNALERQAARAFEASGFRVVTCPPGTSASRLAEDGHLFVTLGHDA